MTTTLPAPVGAAQALVQPALRKAVAELHPSMRRIVGYHLGWTDEFGHPASDGGGKALRPTLALLSARAVGADPDAALPGALAVELVHNFSLVHDDVMDGDAERRHRPTVWKLFGVPAAILAGDAMLTLAVEVLGQAADPAAARCLTDAVQELIVGQSEDVDFEVCGAVGLAQCLEMAAGKTGALMRCATEIGAVLGGGSPDQVAALRAFGAHLGLAFQLVDDLLGIWGAPEVTGKPVLSDLRSRKKSVPVVAALNSETREGTELALLYAEPEPGDESQLHEMARLMAESGALEWTRREARAQVLQAQECLECVGAPSEIELSLRELAAFMTERDL